MKKTFFYSLLLSSVISLVSCSKKENTDIVITSQVNMESQMLNFANTKVENNAHGGRFYSSVDSVGQYGAGYSYVIPDSLKDKNLMIYVTAWVREQANPINGTIAVGVSTSKGVAVWTEIRNKNNAYQPGTWTQIVDSVNVASSVLKDSFVEVSIFGLKSKGADRFDLDDLDIKYRFYK